jgi:hypothetical protein
MQYGDKVTRRMKNGLTSEGDDMLETMRTLWELLNARMTLAYRLSRHNQLIGYAW